MFKKFWASNWPKVLGPMFIGAFCGIATFSFAYFIRRWPVNNLFGVTGFAVSAVLIATADTIAKALNLSYYLVFLFYLAMLSAVSAIIFWLGALLP